MSEAVQEQVSASGPAPGSVVASRGITRTYGGGETAVEALRGVDIDLAPGKFVAIMGPSGSGKSTLMHILAGLDKPTSGQVWIDGVEITHLPDKALTLLRRNKIGFVFQFFNLLPMLSARENIELPLSISGATIDQEWLATLAGQVGLTDRLTHRPAELSGGQQQRVAIARALATKPAVIFADEPTGNLDSKTGTEILEVMHRSVQELNQTIVMVTHDARAAAVADELYFLQDGQIVRRSPHMSADAILDVMKSLE